ncbi:glycerophosphodiester phosphodiesterase [Gottschalkiaceae bacterium SANA]|nr:glycerophosphodiester phosphodiesterase [Gottschalkiaceae bacterium SANA]
MLDVFQRSWKDFFFGFRRFTKYQIVTRLFLALIILPIYRKFFSFLMRSRGFDVFANNQIQEFLFSIQGFIATLFLLITVTVIIFIEIGGVVVLSQQVYERLPESSYWKVFSFCLERARKIGIFGGLLFLFYMAVLVPWLKIGVSNSLIQSLQIPPFIIEYAQTRLWADLILKTISVIGIIYSIQWVFSLHLILLKDMRASVAMKRSRVLLKEHWWEIIKDLAFLAVLNGVVIIIIIGIFFAISAISIFLVNSGLAGQRVFLSVFESFIALIALAGTWVMVPYGIHRITVLLNRFEVIEPIAERIKIGGNIQWIDWFFTRRKVIAGVLVIFVFFLAGFMQFYTAQLDQTRPVYITAHRGDMQDAPENTIAGIESAIKKKADYAEVDVQMLKDGHLILLHDSNFLRTTNVDLPIAEATYDQVVLLNAAANMDWPHVESVPLLDNVLGLAKGRIRLNLELKTADNQKEIAIQVTQAIEAAGMEREVVVTSLDESVLNEVEKIMPQVRTGLIVVLTLGEVEKIPVDFFSMEISRVNEDRVEKIHLAGKEVHVWTVNTEEEMEEVLSMGVDGLITDQVGIAQQVLKERKELRLQ